MGWQTEVAIQLQAGNTIINPNGAFTYSPSPGAGNLVSSITSGAATDNFGNAIPAEGTFNYFGSGASWFAVGFTSGTVAWYHATSQAGPYTLQEELSIVAGSSPILQSSTPVEAFTNGSWTQATLSGGFSNSGSGVNGLWYRLCAAPGNTVEIIADITNSGVGNSTCFALPTGLQPATGQNHPAGWNNPAANNSATVPWVFVFPVGSGSPGAIQITGMEAQPIEIFFHIFVPLDAL